jgi:uncharacterized protein with FMN-binding domain
MRRAAAVILGTLTGTALMIGAKVGNATPGDDPALAGDVGGVVVSGGDAGNPAAGPSATASGGRTTPSKAPTPGATPTAAGTGTKASTSGPTTATKPGSTPTKAPTTKPPATTPPPSSGLKNGTYNASAQVVPPDGRNRGTLSMTVTISGGQISNIQASETNPSEPNCWNSACPKLKSEALSAQSANINNVSGATGTTKAYKSSLQAILNSAKA